MRTPFPSVQLAFSPTLTMSISWFILSLVLDLNRSTHALDFNPDPREIQNDIPNIQPLCAYNDVRDDDHDHGHLHDHDPIDAFKWVTEPGDFFDNAESATDATDADLSNPSTDPPAEPPVQYQYLGCISFEGYSDLLRHHGVRGLKEPSRANCLSSVGSLH
ncbi:hypothetical protein I316_05429 [Kwoniella heveanensis BCC8398]|uniref:Uncharacterized protein n=1 Tax=Kwoniella heveanensis BCC8398 TaxID=1296120 RepID=A0A1B9GP61_9TREE|nr:hypothetical protein I316_05429 [Kwoniella heveanensis BCC8398]